MSIQFINKNMRIIMFTCLLIFTSFYCFGAMKYQEETMAMNNEELL